MRDRLVRVLRNFTVVATANNREKEFQDKASKLFGDMVEEWYQLSLNYTRQKVASNNKTVEDQVIADTNDLLVNFEEVYAKYAFEYYRLLTDFNDLQPVAKKNAVEEDIKKYQRKLKDSLGVHQYLAKARIDEIKNLGIDYPSLDLLQNLINLTIDDVYAAWLDPKEYLLSDDLLDVLED